MELAQGLLPLASSMIYNAQRTAKEAERAALVAQLRSEHPELLTPSDELYSLNCAAKNIRIELKAAFPGHKFSVRIESYSMGNNITVKWVDGPAAERVDAIINRYQQGHFDGMTDCYEYSNNLWTDSFGGSLYVHSSRDYSPQIYAWAKAEAATQVDHPGNIWQAEIWTVLRALNIKAVKTPEAN